MHPAHFETRDSDIPLADEFSAFQDVHGSFLMLLDPHARTGLALLLLSVCVSPLSDYQITPRGVCREQDGTWVKGLHYSYGGVKLFMHNDTDMQIQNEMDLKDALNFWCSENETKSGVSEQNICSPITAWLHYQESPFCVKATLYAGLCVSVKQDHILASVPCMPHLTSPILSPRAPKRTMTKAKISIGWKLNQIK